MKKHLFAITKFMLVLILFTNVSQAQINNFPYIEGFESNDGGWIAGGTNSSWAHGEPANSFINGTVGCGTKAWVTNLNGGYNSNEESFVESPVFDFTSLTSDPIIKFDHIFETEGCCDEGWVEFSIDGGTTWTKLGTSTSGISNWYNDSSKDWWDGNSGTAGAWRTASHTLTGLAGESAVKLRFILSTDASVVKEGFGIDNIIVHNGIIDLNVDAFVQPSLSISGFGATESVEVAYTNFGSATISTLDLCYSIDGAAPVCETFMPNLVAGASGTSTFAVSADLSGLGMHNIVAYYTNPNEDFLCNDTVKKSVFTTEVISSFPYFEDFESNDGGFTSGGNSNSWEYGIPSGSFISEASGCGENAWVTNLSGDYSNSESSYLETILFDFSSLTSDPILSFDHIFETEGCCDEGWVEFSIDGGLTWTKLGTSTTGLTNWYNDAGNNWWDGTSGSAGDWRFTSHTLTGLAGESNVKIRFFMSTDGSSIREGFGVDNITIYQSMDIVNLSPVSLIAPVSGCTLTSSESIAVDVINTGGNSTSSVDICYKINGGAMVCETVAIVIAPDITETVNLTASVDLSTLGTYAVEIISAHAGDFNSCNDTLVSTVSHFSANSTTDTQIACVTYDWIDGNTYTSSNNIATYTLTNAAGCDSVVTLDLTINSPNTGTDIQTACDSYTWIDGNTYSSSNNTATYTLTNVGGCDSVVTLDLTINSSSVGTDVQYACGSYLWIDGITYTATNNTAMFTLSNSAGCDSIVTLDLTILSVINNTETIVACDSLVWQDGSTYYSSTNTPSVTYTSVLGCDSIVTLDLTINNSSFGVDVQTGCDSYTWIDGVDYTTSNSTATYMLTNVEGCDSLVTLDLTMNYSNGSTDVQSACAGYTWMDGNTYMNSNSTATFALTNTAGCDSIITLNLTILAPIQGDLNGNCVIDAGEIAGDLNGDGLINGNEITGDLDGNGTIDNDEVAGDSNGNGVIDNGEIVNDADNNGVGWDCSDLNLLGVNYSTTISIYNNTELQADQTGWNYQWLDCENQNSPIAGANYRNYSVTQNGDYAVEISSANCIDTSSCISVVNVGIFGDQTLDNVIAIYPNPSNGIMIISVADFKEKMEGKVYNAIGELVQVINLTDALSEIQLNVESGIYFIEIGTRAYRVIVQ